MDAEEWQRAQRFYFDHHRRRFIAAHAFLRLILARYVYKEAHLLQFTCNSHGKPTLIQGEGLQFNLSHSQEMALLAVGKDLPLGIDLEFFSSRPYLGIAQELFSPLELQAFERVPKYAQSFSFFHIWAQKEAFIKACGLGLSYPTRTFSVHAWPLDEQAVYDPLHLKTVHMKSFMPTLACAAAICFDPTITQFRYHILDT